MFLDLAAGDYRARISSSGGALAALSHRGRELVRAVEGEPPRPFYRGAVLAPWPNRIADGRYAFDDATHQLPLNEVERRCALHGLLVWTTWQVAEHDAGQAVLTDTIWPRPGYPFTVEVEVRYALDAELGLTITVAARNVGEHTAPYGTSIHPYLTAGDATVDTSVLRFDAARVLDVDDRLLPTAERDVDGTGFDFRDGRVIGAVAIDHAYTAVPFADGAASASLTTADGDGVRMTWDDRCRWVQVHTCDLPGQALHRAALAFEPMTCPPDAYNSGDGLIRLDPGATDTTTWRIDAVTGS